MMNSQRCHVNGVLEGSRDFTGRGRTEGTKRDSDDNVYNWPGKVKGLPLGSSPRCSG